MFQDESIQLLIEARRANVAVKQARRAKKVEAQISGDPKVKAELRLLDDQYDDLQALEACINNVRRSLSQTDSDIRLSAKLIEQQIRLGELKPLEETFKDVVPTPMTPPEMAPVDVGSPRTPFEPPSAVPYSYTQPVADEIPQIFATAETAPAVQGATHANLEDIAAFLFEGPPK